jgi:hypothetical protein
MHLVHSSLYSFVRGDSALLAITFTLVSWFIIWPEDGADVFLQNIG